MTTKISPPKLKFSVSDLIKQGRVDEDDLKKLLSWLEEQSDLPQCGEQLMSLFLMACEGKLEDAKNCLRSYYTCKKDAPELFDNRDLNRDDIMNQMEMLEYIVMPKRTKEGYVVIMHRLYEYNYSEYHMEVAMKLLMMTLDLVLYSNPPTGLIIIFDMRGVGIRHLTRVKISAVRKFFTFVQEAINLQLKDIHVLNCVWFIDKVMNIIKPFYKPELMEKLHLHKTDLDMEQFYETHVPKSCLPSDLGGELESCQDLHRQTCKQLEEMQEFFQQEEKMRHSVNT